MTVIQLLKLILLCVDCFEDETEYIGTDITEITTDIVTETPENCQIKCIQEDTCNAWSYHWDGKICKLKYAAGEKANPADPSTISGPKFCLGKWSKNIPHTIIKVLLLLEYSALQQKYCGLSLADKRTLLESDDVTGDQVESLLASVRYWNYISTYKREEISISKYIYSVIYTTLLIINWYWHIFKKITLAFLATLIEPISETSLWTT